MRAKRKTIVQVEDPKYRQLLPPYQDYHSPGPYFRKERLHGRMYINLLKGKKTLIGGMLYARYLLEVKLGRPLKDDCEVDHIDGFPWNDRVDNLQELTASENHSKGRASTLDAIQHARTHILLKCPLCGNWFERLKTCRLGKLTFCSCRCNGKFLHSGINRDQVIQETREIELPSNIEIPSPYYEPFEKFSAPRMRSKLLYLCECGKPLLHGGMRYCTECRHRMDYRSDIDGVTKAKQEIADAIREEYVEYGKIVLHRFCKRFGLTDNGLTKRIRLLFGKPYKEVIAEICGNK